MLCNMNRETDIAAAVIFAGMSCLSGCHDVGTVMLQGLSCHSGCHVAGAVML